jgi:hypothetical protein
MNEGVWDVLVLRGMASAVPISRPILSALAAEGCIEDLQTTPPGLYRLRENSFESQCSRYLSWSCFIE